MLNPLVIPEVTWLITGLILIAAAWYGVSILVDGFRKSAVAS